MRGDVVSYRNSTSNHNQRYDDRRARCVVSYRNSTSNHNVTILIISDIQLYLIEILHQTTTQRAAYKQAYSCILSKFYIKPQRFFAPRARHDVVSYRNSTSNHNNRYCECCSLCCILSKFYIKPQL